MPAKTDDLGQPFRKSWKRLAVRIAATTLGVLLTFTAFMGFLHTKPGRPLMARIFGARCPMLSATPETVDNARKMGVLAGRGSSPAPARPAFGFHLDSTTVDDVQAWAKRHRVSCEHPHAWLVQCADVAPETLDRPTIEGRIEELTFGFRPDGRLVNVSTLRRRLTPSQGRQITQDIASNLYSALGRSTASPAQIAQGKLSEEALSSLRVSLRYSDYFADVTAMNLPTTGVAVREQYLSATD